MLLILKRHHRNETTYDGRIYIRGQFVCDTVEHCRSALPVGTYLLVKGVCKAHMKQVFFIQPPLPKLCEECMLETSESLNQRLFCRTPMLKPGNGAYRQDDRGIRIGQRLIPGCLIQPNSHFKRLSNRLSKALKRHEELLFTIVEELQP